MANAFTDQILLVLYVKAGVLHVFLFVSGEKSEPRIGTWALYYELFYDYKEEKEEECHMKTAVKRIFVEVVL